MNWPFVIIMNAGSFSLQCFLFLLFANFLYVFLLYIKVFTLRVQPFYTSICNIKILFNFITLTFIDIKI